ncbi:MAG: hypothetical protein V4586_10390 [Pseudomonadota bacterium]
MARRPGRNRSDDQRHPVLQRGPFDPTVTWTRTAVTSASNFVITLFFAAQTLIRVRGIGLAAGPWMAAALGTLIPDMWNTDATAMWTTNANPMWSS